MGGAGCWLSFRHGLEEVMKVDTGSRRYLCGLCPCMAGTSCPGRSGPPAAACRPVPPWAESPSLEALHTEGQGRAAGCQRHVPAQDSAGSVCFHNKRTTTYWRNWCARPEVPSCGKPDLIAKSASPHSQAALTFQPASPRGTMSGMTCLRRYQPTCLEGQREHRKSKSRAAAACHGRASILLAAQRRGQGT